MRIGLCFTLILLVSGCASTPSDTSAPAVESPRATADAPKEATHPVQKATPPANAVLGAVDVDVSDVTGKNLPARLELQSVDGTQKYSYEIPTGVQSIQSPVGDFYAFVYVYDNEIPVMVHAQEFTIVQAETGYILVNLLEGASGKLSVHDYDQDGDLAIDKVELIAGTDPEDPTSIPGRRPVVFDDRVFRDEDRWYSGELNAVSRYGGGEETVAELIKRAEQEGLDFLAITDLNTMDACNDPDFHSDSVVLIPALAWGTVEEGIALIYGPATVPDLPTSIAAAQAECERVQSQGGVFTIAHPCFAESPWKWGLSKVNAVQVWNGVWREPAPLLLSSLPEALKNRDPSNGQLIRSIAATAAIAGKTAAAAAAAKRKDLGISANDQAAKYWDYELNRGEVSSVIAGGMVDRRSKPMGSPRTWVRAPNKSAAGILFGLRKGRTFVNGGEDGVQINFRADALSDGTIDVGVGGAVPLKVDVAFNVIVYGAAGAKVELLRDGHQVIIKTVDSNQFGFVFNQVTDYSSAYRVRVIRQPEKPEKGYGPVEVLALSSPIYAADISLDLLRTGTMDEDNSWIHLKSKFTKEDPRLLQ